MLLSPPSPVQGNKFLKKTQGEVSGPMSVKPKRVIKKLCIYNISLGLKLPLFFSCERLGFIR